MAVLPGAWGTPWERCGLGCCCKLASPAPAQVWRVLLAAVGAELAQGGGGRETPQARLGPQRAGDRVR